MGPSGSGRRACPPSPALRAGAGCRPPRRAASGPGCGSLHRGSSAGRPFRPAGWWDAGWDRRESGSRSPSAAVLSRPGVVGCGMALPGSGGETRPPVSALRALAGDGHFVRPPPQAHGRPGRWRCPDPGGGTCPPAFLCVGPVTDAFRCRGEAPGIQARSALQPWAVLVGRISEGRCGPCSSGDLLRAHPAWSPGRHAVRARPGPRRPCRGRGVVSARCPWPVRIPGPRRSP